MVRRSLKVIVVSIVTATALALCCCGACAGVVFVNSARPDDTGDGLTWQAAKKTVQAGLNAAASGDEVWVAAGTYVERITLKDGVALCGGFAGGETTRDERQWLVNETILDGGDIEEGTVVTAPSGATASTVLDGFTIRNGTSGIACYNSTTSITNNTISGNGRGITCYSSSPTITKNTITGNLDNGIYCQTRSSPTISANTISANADGIDCQLLSSPAIVNNTISGNGRGIYCHLSSSPAITNNTISGSLYGIYCESTSSPSITNNIVAFNSTGIYKSGGTPVLRNNCVHNPEGKNYSGLSAGTGDIAVDPKFQSAAYGRLHIQPDSPCVDAGLGSSVGEGWKDMDGQLRIQGTHVDIGADESDGTVWPEYGPVIVRVSPDGVDDAAHDGSTWALAKRTVQAGIEAASGGEVWVAAGVYSERITQPAYVYLYGGFAGGESSLDERDWGVNSTVLDAGGGDTVVTAVGGQRNSTIDGFTIRNGEYGILFYGSSPSIANNKITGNGGGGISCSSSSPSVANNTISGNGEYGINCSSSSPTITNNTISGNGRGITCYSSSPTITNNTISGNGDGIDCASSSLSSLTITNNTIAGNSGAGISCYESSPTIRNNVVAFNATGIYRSGGTPVLRNNCVFNPDGTDYDGLTAGTGDISVDPLFADRAVGNLRLLPGSPCIDAGYDAGVPPWLLVDFDGNPRISGAHVDMGAFEFQAAPPAASIPEGRGGKDGAQVSLTGVIVTAAWPDVFYVEQADRACGIRVEKAGHGLSVGQSAAVAGTMATTADGERMVEASSVSGVAGDPLAPLGMTIRWLGGGSTADYSAANGTGQQGVTGGTGLNNIGLLVRTCGRFTYVDSSTFTIDDGSGVQVKCVVPADVTIQQDWQYVCVTGISSCGKTGGLITRLVRVQTQADIEAIPF